MRSWQALPSWWGTNWAWNSKHLARPLSGGAIWNGVPSRTPALTSRNAGRIRGKREIDLSVDPSPDLVIVDPLGVRRAAGWFYGLV